MSNTVDRETAALLTGWDGETEKVWVTNNDRAWAFLSSDNPAIRDYCIRLPAPSIYELRYKPDGTERLTYDDFGKYFCVVVDPELHEFPITTLGHFCEWIFTVTSDADALAKVWLWVQEQKATP